MEKKTQKGILAGILICLVLLLLLGYQSVKNSRRYQQLQTKEENLNERLSALEKKAGEKEKVVVRETAKTPETAHVEENTEPESETKTRESESKDETDGSQAVLNLHLDTYLDEEEANGAKWAVSVQNLSDGARYEKNAEESMQSASVIKVFIMAAVYGKICYPASDQEAVYAQEQYDGELKELLTNMITVSDNEAANRLVELLGNGDFEAGKQIVNTFCQENGYTGTHLGRRFLAEDPTDDNFTTAADCGKLLRAIYEGSCVSQEASAKMLELLKGQTRTGKIPSGLPQGITAANKTGEMSEGYGLGCIENDIAIVYGEQQDYVICVLANDLAGRNEEAIQKIQEISSYVYEMLR